MIDRQPAALRDAAAFSAAIEELGVRAFIESRDGLLLLTPDAEGMALLGSPATRGALIGLARRHGFTHVAVELSGDGGAATRSADASVSRD